MLTIQVMQINQYQPIANCIELKSKFSFTQHLLEQLVYQSNGWLYVDNTADKKYQTMLQQLEVLKILLNYL
jgi:N-acetylmuramoyl-L-alanine amidase CwlA